MMAPAGPWVRIRAFAVDYLLITLPVSLYFALSETSSRQANWGKARMGLMVTDLVDRRRVSLPACHRPCSSRSMLSMVSVRRVRALLIHMCSG